MAAETLPKHFQFHINDVIKAARQSTLGYGMGTAMDLRSSAGL